MSQKESIVALSPLKEEDTIIGIFHWLASFGEQFAQKSLLSKVDSIRLLNDKIYASEEFIRSYAYARANAPLSYRINALKALKKKGQSSTTDTLSFYKMRVEKINEKVDKKKFNDAMAFFDTLNVDMSNFKFDRDEANKR